MVVTSPLILTTGPGTSSMGTARSHRLQRFLHLPERVRSPLCSHHRASPPIRCDHPREWTLLFNQGQKLYATTGDWANGSGGVTQLNDGSTLGGDMATCTTPYSDSDNDGLQDFLEENVHSTDPHDTDTDDDGLEDYSEILNGTDPTNPDSDGDGLFDGHEVSIGTDPNTVEDTDGDGTPDWWDEDEDGDGISGTPECRPSDPDAYQLLNGGFEEPDQSGTNQQHAESNVPSWNTTESDSDGADIETIGQDTTIRGQRAAHMPATNTLRSTLIRPHPCTRT